MSKYEIIKRSNKFRYAAECNKCGCVFKFDKFEVSSRLSRELIVNCPECDSELVKNSSDMTYIVMDTDLSNNKILNLINKWKE